MFRPHIKRTGILVFIAAINLLLVYLSYISYEFEPSKDYAMKIESSKIMREALDMTNQYSQDLISDSIRASSFSYDRFNSSFNNSVTWVFCLFFGLNRINKWGDRAEWQPCAMQFGMFY